MVKTDKTPQFGILGLATCFSTGCHGCVSICRWA